MESGVEMKTILVELTVFGRAKPQPECHPADRLPTEYWPDKTIKYTTLCVPRQGDILFVDGNNVTIKGVVQVLKSLTDGSGTTYTTNHYEAWA